jgi:hypothetical protein
MKQVGIVTLLTMLSVSILWPQVDSAASPDIKQNSIGLGLGIPYGVLGVNADINIVPNVNISLGIGTTILAGVGYNIGLKYFFSPVENPLRPRISAYYGTNEVSELTRMYTYGNVFYASPTTEKKSYTGINLGIGVQWMWGITKSNGIDFDIIYLATSGLDIDELRSEGYNIEDPGKIKVSVGYRHSL